MYCYTITATRTSTKFRAGFVVEANEISACSRGLSSDKVAQLLVEHGPNEGQEAWYARRPKWAVPPKRWSRPGRQLLSVTVKTLAGDSFDVDALNSSTTIAQLKLQLRDPARSGALVSHQELFLPDCEDALANHSTLDACGVVGGTVLFLVVSGDAVGADGLFQQMALVDVARDGVACRVDRSSEDELRRPNPG